MSDDRRLVYSTDGGSPVPQPKRRPTQPSKPQLPNDGILRISRERRRGSTVSLITGLDEPEIESLAKELKKLCGSGGTAKNGIVEIQGDHRDRIVEFFERSGRKIKRAGS
ncbi:MAG: stress response translation initiation inhibitor YciH [Candidatus Baltobacteraceae bacterium]